MSVMDSLVELHIDNWPKLQIIFRDRWPFSAYAYYFIDTNRRWIKDFKYTGTKIFVPNGDMSVGMVAVCEEIGEFYPIVVFCLQNDFSNMASALLSTNRIKWNSKYGITVSGLNRAFLEDFKEVLKRLDMRIVYANPTHCIFKDRDVATNTEISIPSDISIKPLTDDHIPTLNETWPHRFPGSEKFLSLLIRLNGGYGIFQNSGDQPIAWIGIDKFGSLCHLYCQEQHRGKGYAQLLVKFFERKIAEEGKNVHSFVLADNASSVNLFRKLGYDIYTDVVWMKIMNN